MSLTAEQRVQIRRERDRRARRIARADGLNIELAPEPIPQCEALTGVTWTGERCTNRARPGSRFCGCHDGTRRNHWAEKQTSAESKRATNPKEER